MFIIIEEKENVMFMCLVYGDFIFNIMWLKENGILLVGRFFVVFDSLFLWNVLRSDFGNYICIVISIVGIILLLVELYVYLVFEFMMDFFFGFFNIFIGDLFIIFCLVESDLKLKMIWFLLNVFGVCVFDNNILFIVFVEFFYVGMYIC